MKKALFSVFFILSFNLFAFEKVDYEELLLSAEQLRSSDRAKFIEYLEKIRPHFDELTIDQRYFYMYLNGYKLSYEGKIDQGIKSYKHVFDNTQNRKLKHRSAISLINVYAYTRDWLSGFNYLDYVNDINTHISEPELRHSGWITSGIFYNELELYDLALLNVKRLREELVTGRNLCFTNILEAQAYVFQHKTDIGEEYFNNVISSCLGANEIIMANVGRYYYARHLINVGRFQEAKTLLVDNLENIEATQYKFSIIGTYSVIARAALELGDYELASSFAKKTTSDEESLQLYSVIYPVLEARKTLYEIALKESNFKLALERLVALQESEKRRSDDVKSKQLAIEMAKHQAREKDNEITLLNKQNQILQLENELTEETATFNRWLIILLTLVATILVLWLFYVKRSQQRLRFLAEYDSLTKISNRAHFTQNAEDILVYYRNNERTASLILFDLDNFKKINDTNGHLVGDEVLRLTAAACKSCVRKVDVFGRVGGEEFAILLPGCEHEQALKIAEDCRQKVNEIDTTQIGHEFDISASFGVTDTGASGYELKDLLANADEAMYLAKRRGRNRVVQHTKD